MTLMTPKKIALLSLLLLSALLAYGIYQHLDRGRLTTAPEYTGLQASVSKNDLSWMQDPAVKLSFGAAYRYLGGQKFVLYGVANAEQHFFVKTTPDNKLQSVFWIQFEGYLQDNDYRYDYDDSPLRLSLNGYEFYVDTAVVRTNPKNRKRGSDGSLARQFLASKGYRFPDEFAYARLVHLSDASRRKELMIIFVDDLAQTGFRESDLKEGGPHADRWRDIEKRHLDKVRENLTLASH